MPRIVHLRWEMFRPQVCLADLTATAAVHELVLVGAHHLLDDGRLAVLRQALAPRRMVVLLVDDHMPAAERAIADEILNDGTIPVILTTGGPPGLTLTAWLDPQPPRRTSPDRHEFA
jgi:hypothetical protein